MSDITDNFGDLDDSAMDVEGPTALMYRYSRRKSDSKSDENSQNSKCERFAVLYKAIRYENNYFVLDMLFFFNLTMQLCTWDSLKQEIV